MGHLASFYLAFQLPMLTRQKVRQKINLGPEGVTNVELISVKDKNSQLQTTVTSKEKELKQKTSNEGNLPYVKSSSPYVYRGAHREQQKVEQSKKDTIVIDTPENIPAAEYLTAQESNGESVSDRTKEPTAEHSNSYSFLTAPGYRTHHK